MKPLGWALIQSGIVLRRRGDWDKQSYPGDVRSRETTSGRGERTAESSASCERGLERGPPSGPSEKPLDPRLALQNRGPGSVCALAFCCATPCFWKWNQSLPCCNPVDQHPSAQGVGPPEGLRGVAECKLKLMST